MGIAADYAAKTYWIYSDTSVSEIVVTDEDRDLWEIYLNKKSFTAALAFAKVACLDLKADPRMTINGI
jgi:vacuolar protein sorting-associated protein 18